MTLTTIIPTFNRPNFLKQCLKSVANQTIKPDEIFIIDNNKDSNINKKVFSECLKELNLNLKYFENYGNIQSLRNDPAKVSNCELISFLDDDDQWKNNYVEKSLDLFRSKNIDALYTSMDVVDENNSILSEIILNKDYKLSEILVFNPGFFHSNLIIKKNTFLKLNGFESKSGAADRNFFIKLKENKINYFINESKLVIRCDHSSQWSKDNKKMLIDKIIFYLKNFYRIDLLNNYKYIKNMMRIFINFIKEKFNRFF